MLACIPTIRSRRPLGLLESIYSLHRSFSPLLCFLLPCTGAPISRFVEITHIVEVYINISYTVYILIHQRTAAVASLARKSFLIDRPVKTMSFALIPSSHDTDRALLYIYSIFFRLLLSQLADSHNNISRVLPCSSRSKKYIVYN